ncbi:MAG: Aspartate-semialdehyde dehydrogenase [uncultured Solirubrobacteraceae bacterium]|uniref:Aspartate-semialdehyde dehydrogenase n=1 Tax=uncultured Solirubrobacteraceae bacterium TaxID=1162706 RepID=A0A6J4SNI7_9ACTN|nr:MAG: Aspartate-semialdehyde dehydrogenase [uncultured Solirubrobacteraceae bacterium]
MSASDRIAPTLRVALVGATGAVGTVMLRLLRSRALSASEIVPFASPRSVGRELDGGLVVQPLDDETIQGFDVALFSAGATRSREWARRFVDAGAVVVDNSSAFRMADEVPLVVSEVNPEALGSHGGIVANPNCTTMVAMLPLKALHDEFALVSMVATSYQAAGGAGQSGIDELAAQVGPLAADVQQLCDDGAAAAAKVEHSVHHATLAFNVVPLLGALGEDGHTDEERKLRDESRKILGIPDLAVSPLCVRVPVMVGHGVAVRATFAREVDLARALEVLAAFPGMVLDDVPTPLQYAGRDEVAVGRVRRDLADPRTLNFFVVGDNLLKGAALNTVQLAEALVQRGLLRSSRPADRASAA